MRALIFLSGFVCFTALWASGHSDGSYDGHQAAEPEERRTLILQNGVDDYVGTQAFFTGRQMGGTFNSAQQRSGGTLRVAPHDSDTKSVIRFDAIPIEPELSFEVHKMTLVLTFAADASSDTLMLHALRPEDRWVRNLADYNSIDGETPWSSDHGQLNDAWDTIDGIGAVAGYEARFSQISIAIHPDLPQARKALLESWIQGPNNGLVLQGVNGSNTFFSPYIRDVANRPQLVIEYEVLSQ